MDPKQPKIRKSLKWHYDEDDLQWSAIWIYTKNVIVKFIIKIEMICKHEDLIDVENVSINLKQFPVLFINIIDKKKKDHRGSYYFVKIYDMKLPSFFGNGDKQALQLIKSTADSIMLYFNNRFSELTKINLYTNPQFNERTRAILEEIATQANFSRS